MYQWSVMHIRRVTEVTWSILIGVKEAHVWIRTDELRTKRDCSVKPRIDWRWNNRAQSLSLFSLLLRIEFSIVNGRVRGNELVSRSTDTFQRDEDNLITNWQRNISRLRSVSYYNIIELLVSMEVVTVRGQRSFSKHSISLCFDLTGF